MQTLWPGQEIRAGPVGDGRSRCRCAAALVKRVSRRSAPRPPPRLPGAGTGRPAEPPSARGGPHSLSPSVARPSYRSPQGCEGNSVGATGRGCSHREEGHGPRPSSEGADRTGALSCESRVLTTGPPRNSHGCLLSTPGGPSSGSCPDTPAWADPHPVRPQHQDPAWPMWAHGVLDPGEAEETEQEEEEGIQPALRPQWVLAGGCRLKTPGEHVTHPGPQAGGEGGLASQWGRRAHSGSSSPPQVELLKGRGVGQEDPPQDSRWSRLEQATPHSPPPEKVPSGGVPGRWGEALPGE
ncbi:nascent polypeptide-associated complex subunit alpha, muscle-specific form-like [Dama dama]|uniref:nascent polypeptide-associated complex subunit alpha, muscle-specific form-like n=1 Tax=Dama dama TaxID=30532 RepID=UPI002A3592D8|nr:nascent polypeptide-associated complex subunit alpha, muscle-specific form-like [Dama dama]